MKVLIGVDGSSGAFEATALAGQLLSPGKDQIAFYHAPAEPPRGTDAAIRDRAKKALADAARGRSRADWLFGMNLSRAATLAHDETLHVGRVQTPTLALIVEREKAIRAFVPEDYLEVAATFEAPTGRYECTWFRGAAGSGGRAPVALPLWDVSSAPMAFAAWQARS